MYSDMIEQKCKPKPNKSFSIFKVEAFWDNKFLNVPVLSSTSFVGRTRETIVEFRWTDTQFTPAPKRDRSSYLSILSLGSFSMFSGFYQLHDKICVALANL